MRKGGREGGGLARDWSLEARRDARAWFIKFINIAPTSPSAPVGTGYRPCDPPRQHSNFLCFFRTKLTASALSPNPLKIAPLKPDTNAEHSPHP